MKSFSFEIDTTTDVPLWIQLRKRLIHLINIGHYKPGDQLPTVRGLASELAINYNTVNKTYLSMINDGYITSTRGRGVFVAELDPEQNDESTREAALLISDCVDACIDLGLSASDIRILMARSLHALDQDAGTESNKRGEAEEGKPLRIVEGNNRLGHSKQESKSGGAS